MEGNLSFAEVRQRLREIEDQSMASRLQEEEFNKYYNHNRKYRRMVGEDTKHSIREQANEDEFARRERVETVQKIAESDKEIARRLQQQIEEEERERLELQVRMDAELAKALSVNEEFQNTNSSAREISSSQLHNHSPPTSSTFGYLSSNNESCKGSTSPSATNFYESLRLNADDHPREHALSSQTNSSWEVGRHFPLQPGYTERLDNNEHPHSDQNPRTSSSNLPIPLHITSATDTRSTLMASLHPANPLLENIIASNPASSPAPERPLIDFLPPPSNLALGKRP